MKSTLIFALFLLPSLIFAETYYPQDVDYAYLVEENGDYETHLFLKSGDFYRFDEVTYKQSRYLLLEESARSINEHRSFTGFDDDDMVVLLTGTIPYTNNDIGDVEVIFSSTTVSIEARFITGGSIVIEEAYNERFLTREQVAEYLATLINSQDGFEGQYLASELLEQYAEFENVIYYAPDVESIEVSYDEAEQAYIAEVVFIDGTQKLYAIFPKDTKRKIIVDIASRINEFYAEFEEEGFIDPDQVEEVATWIEIPALIDDIKEIVVDQQDDVLFVRVSYINELNQEIDILFQEVFQGDDLEEDSESIAFQVADILDASNTFGSEFDLLALDELISIESVDTSSFESDSLLINQEIATTSDEFFEGETTEETTPTTGETDQVLEDATQSTSSSEAIPAEEGENDELFEQILALILALVSEMNLDIDLSQLSNN